MERVAQEENEQDNVERANVEETPQTSAPAESTQTESFRKSERIRTLTEKGKSLQEAKLNQLTKEFESQYKWKYHINSVRRFMKVKDEELIEETVTTIDTFQTDICNIYDEKRKIESPDNEIR